MRKTGYLVLQNGRVFEGKLFGADKEIMAQLVFTTGMVDYLCTICDSNHLGQMVVQTFPMIGNFGIIPSELEAEKPALSAYIVREICGAPSNFRSEGTLEGYLEQNGIPGLFDVDTRAITKVIRTFGVMNAALMHEKPQDLSHIIEKLNHLPFHPNVKDVTCKLPQTIGDGKYHVVMMDFGLRKSLHEKLLSYGFRITIVPCDTKASDIFALKPNGVALSNGPGDPRDNEQIIAEIRKIKASQVPLLGICLGHQMLALSQGAKMEKLLYGHRGANQSATDLATGISYQTGQNHGFTVSLDALPKNANLRFVNVNDGSCEGLDYTDSPAFSVQFHPEVSGGPLDTMYLFDRFIELMGGSMSCR